MKLQLIKENPNNQALDALIIFAHKKGKEIIFEAGIKGKEILFLLKEAAERENFTAKQNKILMVSGRGILNIYKFIVVGYEVGDDQNDNYLNSLAIGFAKAKEINSVRVGIVQTDSLVKDFHREKVFLQVGETARLANYEFSKYKTVNCEKVRKIEEIMFFSEDWDFEKGIKQFNLGLEIAEAQCFAKDLVNEPSSVTTPSYLEKVAFAIAEKSALIEAESLDRQKAAELGMNSYLSVAKGSDEEPKFIILHYMPANPKGIISLVGKAVTFDTGGLSLKSAEHMEDMKIDMAGAAAVLGIFSRLDSIKPEYEIYGIIPACENMPSGKAIKPGDIVKSFAGKTIEILNTDAEGRLTLADAISYTGKIHKSGIIVDLATLTGACMVALGEKIAGLWSNDKELARDLIIAGKEANEKSWEMPLEESYSLLIKSSVADLKNIQSGRYGGAITAALFLKEFIPEKTAWAHLDIAGPAFDKKSQGIHKGGATGFGVKTILHYLLRL